MWRSVTGCCALVFLVGVLKAPGQNIEELKRESQGPKARLRAQEADKAHLNHDNHDHHDHRHDHSDTPDHPHEDDQPHPVRDWFRTNWRYAGGPTPGLGEIGFFRGLTAPWLHTHRNARGTPWIHPFTIEPPHIHRDLFLFNKHTRGAEGYENEWEYHLDWSISRRIGFFVGIPYLGVSPRDDEQTTGFGDIEFAPRFVLVESERFFLASNLFMSFPTGNADRDLGAGEVILSPLITTWHDLTWHNRDNHWVTAYLNFGPQVALGSGNVAMRYDAALIYSFRGPTFVKDGVYPANSRGHAHHHGGAGESRSEYPVGLTSLYLEFNGEAELQSGGQAFHSLLTGIGYIMTEHAEVRFGTRFPVSQPRQLDIEYVFAFTWMY